MKLFWVEVEGRGEREIILTLMGENCAFVILFHQQ